MAQCVSRGLVEHASFKKSLSESNDTMSIVYTRGQNSSPPLKPGSLARDKRIHNPIAGKLSSREWRELLAQKSHGRGH